MEGAALISHCGLRPELQVTDAEQGSAPETCKIIKKKDVKLDCLSVLNVCSILGKQQIRGWHACVYSNFIPERS